MEGGPLEIARAIDRLLEDPALRERLGQAAKQSVVRGLTWPLVARQFLGLYAREEGGVNAPSVARRRRGRLPWPGREQASRPTVEPNPHWWSPGSWGDLVPRPRILLVANVALPITGGISRYLAGLEQELTRQGFRTTVMSYPASLVRREAARGRSPLRKLGHVAFALACVLRVAGWRLLRRPVIVHSHGASFCLAAAYFARWLGAIGVHTFHSPLHHRSRILSLLAHRLDALLYVSEATRELYERTNAIRNGRVAIVPGGVQPPEGSGGDHSARVHARRRWGIPPDAFLALYVGRVVPEKGVDLLIEALAEASPRVPSALLAVTGPLAPGPSGLEYAARLERLIRERSVEGRVRILGLVPDRDLEDLYRASDILVVPSRWEEPAPMVTVEAMARGLPVIAAAVGGLSDRVRDGQTGLLFPPEDTTHLARHLVRLSEDRETRLRLGEEARRWVDDHATAEKLAEFHSRMYVALCRDGPGR